MILSGIVNVYPVRVYCPGAVQSSGPYLHELCSSCQPLQLCAPVSTVMIIMCVSFFIPLMRTRPESPRFKHKCNRNNTGSIFPLCVSIDCATERSCTQSGASSPSQSTSSHALSSAKSKGSLRRQSKSVVWSLLYTVYTYLHVPVFLSSTHFTCL